MHRTAFISFRDLKKVWNSWFPAWPFSLLQCIFWRLMKFATHMELSWAVTWLIWTWNAMTSLPPTWRRTQPGCVALNSISYKYLELLGSQRLFGKRAHPSCKRYAVLCTWRKIYRFQRSRPTSSRLDFGPIACEVQAELFCCIIFPCKMAELETHVVISAR